MSKNYKNTKIENFQNCQLTKKQMESIKGGEDIIIEEVGDI